MASEILIVDDDPQTTQLLARQLQSLKFTTAVVSDGLNADALLRSRDFSIVLLDLNLPDITGLDLLLKWQDLLPTTPVIMISGAATVPQAVDALKRGAADFLVKPVELSMLEAVLRRTIDRQQIRSENSRLRQLVVGEHPAFLGESELVKELLEEAKRVARSDQPILLEGETGTGKQVLARFIHAHSENSREPLVSVNCAAITETLFEPAFVIYAKGPSPPERAAKVATKSEWSAVTFVKV